MIRSLLMLPVAALMTVAMTATAHAQPTYEGCTDPMSGRLIPSIPSMAVNDIAIAVRSPQPAIVYNPQITHAVSPQTRVFFYWHECAHHQLGHTLGAGHPRMNEQSADCWAIRRLAPRMTPFDLQVHLCEWRKFRTRVDRMRLCRRGSVLDRVRALRAVEAARRTRKSPSGRG